MKKHLMLGVNSGSRACCILRSLLPFDQITPDEIERDDFTHDSTNWCGRDDIYRTLVIRQLKLTNNKIVLKKPIVFRGVDYDHGHEYGWDFAIDEIWEATLMREQEWISVEDALPDDGQAVLIYDGNAKQWKPRVAVARFVRGRTAEQRMRDGDGSIRGGDEYGNNLKPYEWESTDGPLRWFGQHVTHWMPLPEAPRMKGANDD